MKKIPIEQARKLLKEYLVERAINMANQLEIIDGTGHNYSVEVPDDPARNIMGAGRMILISKETGDIIFDGISGE